MKATLLKFGTIAGAAVIGLAAVDMPANAASPYNTGVDALGNLLPGGAVDENWEVFQSNGTTSIGKAVVVDNPGRRPLGIPTAWIPNGPDSKWIAEDVNGTAGVNQVRVYQTTFTASLGEFIKGRVAGDNFILDIFLNGASTGLSFGDPFVNPATVASSAFDGWNEFTLDGLLVGTNTLGFKVQDVGSITGFRAEYEVIPTPALLPGLIGLGVAALRRKKDETAEENA